MALSLVRVKTVVLAAAVLRLIVAVAVPLPEAMAGLMPKAKVCAAPSAIVPAFVDQPAETTRLPVVAGCRFGAVMISE